MPANPLPDVSIVATVLILKSDAHPGGATLIVSPDAKLLMLAQPIVDVTFVCDFNFAFSQESFNAEANVVMPVLFATAFDARLLLYMFHALFMISDLLYVIWVSSLGLLGCC